MAAKWGHGIKIRRGLRIVQRLTPGGFTWYREERVAGQAVRVSLDTADEREALRKAIAGPEDVPPVRPSRVSPKAVTPGSLTLEKALDEYETWYQKSHKASGFAVTLPTVEKFVDSVGADVETRAVIRGHVQAFIDRYESKSPVYVRNEYARVRAFLRWIDKRHQDAVDPHAVKGIELPKDESVTEEVPPLEVLRSILRKLTSHPWLADYCTVLLETGMRPGEALAVRGCDLRGDLLDIKPHDGWSPKSKWSVRTIQLSPAAARILKAHADKLFDRKLPIFGLPTGKIRDPKYVGKMYRDAMRGKDGEIPEDWKAVNLYLWRHAFASLHAQEGPAFMELSKLSSYLGHSPGSSFTLERWYVDRRAMRRGSPVSLTGEAVETKIVEIRK
jgi:integrase